jgi:capsular polysaccharide biosynthesis protein
LQTENERANIAYMQRVEKLADLTGYTPPPGAPGFDYLPIDPGGRSPAPAPLFLFGPAPPIVHEELFGQFDTPPVGCYRIAEGGVAANGIPLQRDTAFTAPSLLHPKHVVIATLGRMARRPLPHRHIDGMLAIIYGPAYQTYGHWLCDFLPRLWVLAATGHDLGRIAYAMPPDLSDAARHMLLAIGIGASQIIDHDYLTEHLTADLLLVPTGLRLGNRVSPDFGEATRFWIGRLRARNLLPPSPAGTRIFLSRGNTNQQRAILNREAVEAIGAERGFMPISPETLPFIEQVALFTGATMLVGEYGSALHSAVFSAPSTVACGLRGNVRHPSFIQSGMGAALGQHTGYVLGDAAGQTVEQRFTIDLAEFERALDIVEAVAAERTPA